MFSFPMVSLPACSSAISSSTGAIILHGPHHSAQKSTSTGTSEALTCSSKVASDRVAIFSLIEVSSRRSAPGADPPLIRTTRHGGCLFPRSRGRLLPGLQPPLGVQGGHATAARRRHCLAVRV